MQNTRSLSRMILFFFFRFPPTVLEKYFAVLLQLTKANRSSMLPSLEGETGAVSAAVDQHPSLCELLREWVVPSCLTALPKAISSCKNILDNFLAQSNIESFLTYQLKPSDTCDKGEGGVRLQWKILCSCIAILSGSSPFRLHFAPYSSRETSLIICLLRLSDRSKCIDEHHSTSHLLRSSQE